MFWINDSPVAVPDKKNQSIYRSMVARLKLAATWLKFDIASRFAVAQLARFCAPAGPTHWAALHHLQVMEYLAKYPSFKLLYRKHPQAILGLDGFCDSGNSSFRGLTTGNVFRYCGAPIHLKSKLKKTIALSTAEAEYCAASNDRLLPQRLSISHPSSLTWGLSQRDGRRSTRTTTHTSSGPTTSSADGSVPSTLTFGSTSRAKRSSKDISVWSVSTLLTSSPTSLPRAYSRDSMQRACQVENTNRISVGPQPSRAGQVGRARFLWWAVGCLPGRLQVRRLAKEHTPPVAGQSASLCKTQRSSEPSRCQ